jgi:hypothetical protein
MLNTLIGFKPVLKFQQVEFKDSRKCVMLVYMYFQNYGLIWLSAMKGYIHSKNNFCCYIVVIVTNFHSLVRDSTKY